MKQLTTPSQLVLITEYLCKHDVPVDMKCILKGFKTNKLSGVCLVSLPTL